MRARQTAVVPAATTWREFPTVWGQLLGEVWDCLRSGGVDRGCRNVMLYRDNVPNVEVGAAHDAVVSWGGAHGHEPNGARWEVYRPHSDDPAAHWVEVSWLLSRSGIRRCGR